MKTRKPLAFVALAGAALLVTASPALANTSNVTSVSATSTVNPDGTDTVTLSGTWTWPAGQPCVGRYGTGWAVGWWGIGSTATPANNVTLTKVGMVTSSDQGENGSAVPTGSSTSTGSLAFPSGTDFAGKRFYVGTYYDGQEIFTQDFCNRAQPPDGTSSAAFSGTWTASATYPSASDVPAEICVNTYDEHGTQGKPSSAPGAALSNDFKPTADKDNSIQQKQFLESANCASTAAGTPLPIGSVGGFGLAALAGVGFFVLQRRSRTA